MTANNPKITQMRELIEQINTANIAYYRDDAPTMTDRAYDALVDQLKALEKETGITLSGSPTNSVPGEILDELTPVRHSSPRLSADKTKNVDEFARFTKGLPAILSWKLDGLTLVLRYSKGQLIQAITRGRDGIIGEDVTHTVRTFRNVPLYVPFLEDFEVRGEGVISWDSFNRINLSLETPYTHPRGLAAGSTRKLDASEARKRCLEFLAFELVTDIGFTRKVEQLDFLAQQGFSVVPHTVFQKETAPGYIRSIINAMNPKDYAYPVDGLIMEYDDIAYAG